MDLIQLEFYAHSLGGAARVNVLLPSPSPERLEAQGPAAVYAQEAGRKWPTLLLLHGMQGNESAWLRHSMAEQSAAQAGVAVVMPGLLNSYGFDLGFDLSFEQYLRTERKGRGSGFGTHRRFGRSARHAACLSGVRPAGRTGAGHEPPPSPAPGKHRHTAHL